MREHLPNEIRAIAHELFILETEANYGYPPEDVVSIRSGIADRYGSLRTMGEQILAGEYQSQFLSHAQELASARIANGWQPSPDP